MATWTQRSGLEVERTDHALLVRDMVTGVLHELTGDQAEAFEWADRGRDPVPDHLRDALAALTELRLVETDEWNRRRVLAGAAALAAGVAVAAAAGIRAVPRTGAQTAESGSEPVTPPAPTTLDLSFQLVAGGARDRRTGTQSAVGRGSYLVTVGVATGAPGTISSIGLPTPVTVGGGGAMSGGGGGDYAAVSGGGGGDYAAVSGGGGGDYDAVSGGGGGGDYDAIDGGGPGVVVISYPTPSRGVTGMGGTVSRRGGTTYHRFDRSGTFTVA